jgi:T5SS/PEP-CTERM-associated repeat protein
MNTKRFCSMFAAVLLSGVLFSPPAQAQYTADYQTNIISGVMSNWSGDYIIGYTNDAEVLLIQSGGVLSDADGYVSGTDHFDDGVLTGTGNNAAIVNGTGSVWNNGGELYVGGGAGHNNQLIVTNGGAVYSVGGAVGFLDGDNSTVLVTGSGSVWSDAGDLFVGDVDQGHSSLIISDGGVVYDYTGYLGTMVGGNLIVVTGSGSAWSNRNGVILSSAGGDSLIVSNGGAVYDDSATLFGDERESVLVTGTGSVWNTSGEIKIESPESSVTISNGGVAYCGNANLEGEPGGYALVTGAGSVWSVGSGGLALGGASGLTIADGGAVYTPGVSVLYGEDLITVTGGGLYVTNGLGTGGLELNSSPLTLNGGTVTADQLTVNDSSSFVFTSGLLTSGGTVVSNGQNFAVGDGTNRAVFELLGGVHSFANGLTISSNSFLSGCGTIEGSVVVDHDGRVRANCGGTLNFTGSVTNNGIIHVRDGTTLNFYGPVVNNGLIEVRKGHVRFWAGVQNDGKIVVRRHEGPADHRRHGRR